MREERLADLEQKLPSLSHNEEAIQEVRRFSSLLAVGWRIFASFVRTVIAGANPREVLIRSAIEAPLTVPDQSNAPEP